MSETRNNTTTYRVLEQGDELTVLTWCYMREKGCQKSTFLRYIIYERSLVHEYTIRKYNLNTWQLWFATLSQACWWHVLPKTPKDDNAVSSLTWSMTAHLRTTEFSRGICPIEHKHKPLQTSRNANAINMYRQMKFCCLVTGPSNVKYRLWCGSQAFQAFQVKWLHSNLVVHLSSQPLWYACRLLQCYQPQNNRIFINWNV